MTLGRQLAADVLAHDNAVLRPQFVALWPCCNIMQNHAVLTTASSEPWLQGIAVHQTRLAKALFRSHQSGPMDAASFEANYSGD